jgi:hypothetical protein
LLVVLDVIAENARELDTHYALCAAFALVVRHGAI